MSSGCIIAEVKLLVKLRINRNNFGFAAPTATKLIYRGKTSEMSHA